jgi:hypothetical protein
MGKPLYLDHESNIMMKKVQGSGCLYVHNLPNMQHDANIFNIGFIPKTIISLKPNLNGCLVLGSSIPKEVAIFML